MLQKKSDIILTTVNFLNIYKEQFFKCKEFIGFVSYITEHEKNFKHDENLLKELSPIWEEFEKATVLIATNNCSDENIESIEATTTVDKIFVDTQPVHKIFYDNRNTTNKEEYIINLFHTNGTILVYSNKQRILWFYLKSLRKNTLLFSIRSELSLTPWILTEQDFVLKTFKDKKITILITNTAIDIEDCDNIVFIILLQPSMILFLSLQYSQYSFNIRHKY